MEALSGIADARISAPLIASLKDEDPAVRVAAIEALGHSKPPTAVAPLLGSLKDKDATVRAAAANTLGKVADASSVGSLSAALKDGHWSVRKCAAEALARIQDPVAVLPLAQLLEDPDHDVREAAVEALAKFRDPASVGKLVIALADAESSVRQAAGAALGRIDPEWRCSEEARLAVPALKALQAAQDYRVRHAAAEVIQRIATTTKPDQPANPARMAAHRRLNAGIDALIQALGDWDRDLRQAAAEGLARMSDSRARQALTCVRQDTDHWVRQVAGGAEPAAAK